MKLEAGEVLFMAVAEAKSDRKQAVFDEMKKFAEIVKKAEGCLSCNVFSDKNTSNILVCTHIWKNQQALDKFKQTKELHDFQQKVLPGIVSITLRELTQ